MFPPPQLGHRQSIPSITSQMKSADPLHRANSAGHDRTLPIWFFNELFRPRERPITNVVAVIVMIVTFIPILLAYRLTRRGSA